MRKLLYKVAIFFVVFSVVVSASFAHATSGTPNTLSYQGHLTDSGGNLLGGAGTTYYFKFSFWDSPTVGSGSKVWPLVSPGSSALTVKQGVFSVNIGDIDNGYPDVLDYNFNTNSKIYLQVEISSDNVTFETLSPRSPISSSAFSQVANQVNGTAQSSFGTTTPITNSLISAITTSINQVAMTIKGIAGQVANLFNIQDSSGNSLFTVTAGGNVGVGTTTPVSKLTVNGTGTFYGGDINIYSANQSPTGTGRITWGPTINGNSGALQITSGSTGFYGYGMTAHSASAGMTFGARGGSFNVTSDTGTNLTVLTGGNVGIGSTTPSGKLAIGNGFVYEDANSGILRIGSAAVSGIGNMAGPGFQFAKNSGGEGFRLDYSSTGNLALNMIKSSFVSTTSVAHIQLGAVGQSGIAGIRGNNGAVELTDNSIAPSLTDIYASFKRTGSYILSGNFGIGSTTPSGKLSIETGSTATKGLIVQGTSSQSVSLQEWLTSDSGDFAKINNNGTLEIRNNDPSPNEKALLSLYGPYGSMMFYGTHFTTSNINLADSTSLYLVRGGGNVGVGAFSGFVNSKFSVNGNAVIGSSYNLLTAPTNGLLVEGNVGIGIIAPSSKLDVLETRTVPLTANTAALNIDTTYSPTSNETTYSNRGAFFNSKKGGTFNIASIRGFEAQAENQGSGSVLEAVGFQSKVSNLGAGTIATGIGAFIPSPGGGGPITNAFGAYIGSQKVSGVGTGYGVYAIGANDLNYFAGNTGIGRVPSLGYNLEIASSTIIRSAGGRTLSLIPQDDGIMNITTSNTLYGFQFNGLYTAASARHSFQFNSSDAFVIKPTLSYFSGINLGIGSTTPSAKLTLLANTGDTNTYIMNVSSSTVSSADSLFRVRNDGRVFIGPADVTNSVSKLNVNGSAYVSSDLVVAGTLYMPTLSAGAGSNLKLATYNQPYVYITGDMSGTYPNLNFGIGTSTPRSVLDVPMSTAGQIAYIGSARFASPADQDANGLNSIRFYNAAGTSKGYIGYRQNDVAGIQIAGGNGSDTANLQLGNSSFKINTNGASGVSLVGGDGSGFTFSYGPSSAQKVVFANSGYVGIGTTTPAFPLDVYASTSSDQTYGYLNSSGLIGTSAGVNSYSIRAQGRVLAPEFNAVSDARLKDVQFELDPEMALSLITQLKPVSFKWKSDPDGQPVLGFLAQDVELIIPNAVSKVATANFSDQRTLDYNQLISVVIGAIKDIALKVANISKWFSSGGDKLNIQGEVCVDDTCITKDQFKQLLRTSGGYQQAVVGEGEGSSNVVVPPAEEDQTSTTTPETTSATEETVPAEEIAVPPEETPQEVPDVIE